jgi:predicted phosphodiesterase
LNLKERLGKAIDKFEDKDLKDDFEKRFRELNKPEAYNDYIHRKKIFTFPENGSFDETVTIIPITDIHFGSKQCNTKMLKDLLQFILDTPNCYTIFLGDQTETATKQSIGMGVYEEDFDIRDQIRLMVRMLKPLAEAGKILGILTGNHEMRVAYATSLNPAELIADALDVPYLGFQGYIRINVGKQTYRIFAHHGVGGGSTPAGKLNAMRKLNLVAEADIYLSGHTHGRMDDEDKLMVFDDSGYVRERRRYYVVAGSFLEYFDGYAEMKNLAPSITGSVALKLYPEDKLVQIIK